eukprot:289129-Rhodomonas_salina.1
MFLSESRIRLDIPMRSGSMPHAIPTDVRVRRFHGPRVSSDAKLSAAPMGETPVLAGVQWNWYHSESCCSPLSVSSCEPPLHHSTASTTQQSASVSTLWDPPPRAEPPVLVPG